MSIPMSAPDVVNRYFLEMRAKVLDVAAALDRIGRADQAVLALHDPRLATLRQAIQILLEEGDGRAERVLMLFSDPYDARWMRPVMSRSV